MGFIGPAGPTTTIAAPYGYGQDEDKYEGPTFPHVPTVVRPVQTPCPVLTACCETTHCSAAAVYSQVPLGGVDQYHVASDLPLSTKCTLKEKYEPCTVDHVRKNCCCVEPCHSLSLFWAQRTGYDRYGNLDYAEYTQRPGYYAHAGFGPHFGPHGGPYSAPYGPGYAPFGGLGYAGFNPRIP